jgi:cell division protease FtsH
MSFNKDDKPPLGDQRNQSLSERMGCGSWGSLIVIIAVVALVIFLVSQFGGGTNQGTEISYTAFRTQVEAGNVSEVTISGQEIRGTLKTAQTATTSTGQTVNYTDFITYIPSAVGDNTLLPTLEANGVVVNVQPVSSVSLVGILSIVLPVLLFAGLAWFLLRGLQGRGQNLLQVGKSQAKLYDQSGPRTTFDDVAGADGPKQELREIIGFLRNPEHYNRLGGSIPTGVLLVGPPGTGKTLLARAVAGEAEVPFLSITGSNFMEMFVGVGASRVRDLFDSAKRAAPSIVFIDELDSVGRRRGAGIGGGNDEREQTLNQLLSELDGFEPNQNVIVMAATNRPDILDPALLRPGRFDRQITVDLPTAKAREAILKIHARNKPLAPDVNLEELAQGTPGFSGADLENLLNEAALTAAREAKDAIEAEDIEEARDKIVLGLAREGMVLTDTECKLLAYHESGHTVVAALMPNADPIHKVTIVPRGRAMGVTQQRPAHDKYIYPREYMLDRLAVMMGGRAAERLVFNTATSGASNDLLEATKLARRMVLEWGMSDEMGPMALGSERRNVFLGEELAEGRDYSDETAREVDEVVKTTLLEAYDRAANALKGHRDALDRLADALLEKEELSGEEALKVMGLDGQVQAEEEAVREL